jgi:hydroxypyruvate isomerase
MRFSLNTIGLFPGLSFDGAFRLMRDYGFDTFEVWSLDQIDLAALREEMDRYAVKMSTCCPSFFILNDESRHGEYESSLKKALENARFLSCPSLITQVGQDTGAPRAQQHEAILKGLRRMAPLLEGAGVTLLVEPLNDVKDHKGYYLTDSNEGFDLIREVDSPNVRLLYDVYHQRHMGEDVLRRIEDNLPLIAHYHIAGHPNRDDKIFENFDYRQVFDLLARRNVTSPVGVELFPKSLEDSCALLKKLQPYAG